MINKQLKTIKIIIAILKSGKIHFDIAFFLIPIHGVEGTIVGLYYTGISHGEVAIYCNHLLRTGHIPVDMEDEPMNLIPTYPPKSARK